MKKRGLVIFVLVVSIFISTVISARAQAPTGVCYTTLPANPCARAESCDPYGTFGKIFVEGDVFDQCIGSLGCCCFVITYGWLYLIGFFTNRWTTAARAYQCSDGNGQGGRIG